MDSETPRETECRPAQVLPKKYVETIRQSMIKALCGENVVTGVDTVSREEG